MNQTIPFPCAVYIRDHKTKMFAFSHLCNTRIPKLAPPSLRVKDLAAHSQQANWAALRRACFMVLVTGDTAQCVSVSNVKERRVQFLFHGSEYARSKQHDLPDIATEIQEDYIPVCFYATMSWFTRGWLSSVVPLESGLALFPRTLPESALPTLSRWVESNIKKSMHTSIWATDNGDRYNEHTRQLRPVYSHVRAQKRKRAESNDNEQL